MQITTVGITLMSQCVHQSPNSLVYLTWFSANQMANAFRSTSNAIMSRIARMGPMNLDVPLTTVSQKNLNAKTVVASIKFGTAVN